LRINIQHQLPIHQRVLQRNARIFVVREVESFKPMVVVVPVQLVHILIPENQGQRPDIETEGIQGSLTIQHTGYTYQKYTLRFPESRDEQQHTDAIRLLAHPIAKWATVRIVP
jgi:hypothetical protein